MKQFEWNDSVALGIPAIDEQHKALFGWVNTLSEAITRGDAHEKVGDIIINLISYVTEHFSEEERLMLACRYPELVVHRKEHDKFVEKLQSIQVSFFAGEDMSLSVLDFLIDWLVCHIKGTDQGYSRFIDDNAGTPT